MANSVRDDEKPFHSCRSAINVCEKFGVNFFWLSQKLKKITNCKYHADFKWKFCSCRDFNRKQSDSKNVHNSSSETNVFILDSLRNNEYVFTLSS